MRVDSKEKLERALSEVGIVGEWIEPDKYGYSRLYEFNARGTNVVIEWYCNYPTIMIGSASMSFTHINVFRGCHGDREWIEFTFKGENPLRLMIKG